MNTTYKLVDLAKLLFAFFVVAIHTNIFKNNIRIIPYILNHSLFGLAVPFFFVCSGFFLGCKINQKDNLIEKKAIIKKYIVRLSIMFVFWLLIGLPRQIYDLRDMNVFLIIKSIIKKIIFYPWGALWYILAVILAVVIMIPFIKKNKIKIAVILGIVLYLFALICNNYYFLVKNTFAEVIVNKYIQLCISARNGIFVGLLFVSIGMWLSENINKIKLSKAIIVFVISYIMLFIELFIVYGKSTLDDNALFISFITLIPSMLTILLMCSKNAKINWNTKVLRNYSTGIYLIHSPIINILYLANIKLNCYESFIIVIILSLLILTILYKIDNKYINYVIK